MDLEGEQGAQPKTVDRGAALLKFTLELLQNHPGGLRPRDIFREIEAKVPLDSFDKEPMIRIAALARGASFFLRRC